ncbi:MAG: IS5 family transposase [Oscillospiraceae bacterium]
MYKYSDNQISFSDFGQPVGMKMSPENRWVKKAESIPWSEIERRYARLFTNKKGNVAKPLRLALGACIIQAEYGFSDVETAMMIQEHPYLQFFCGFAEYKDEPPFDASLMVYFRKRLTPEILGEINELIIERACEQEESVKSDDDDDSNNSGTLIVDATCAPGDIRYPTDTFLLNEARVNSEKMIDLLHEPGSGMKPRTYRRRAHKAYNQFVRARKPGQKKIRRCIKQQLGYLGRNLNTIDRMLEAGKVLPPRRQERLETLRLVHQQQRQMYKTRTHTVENRIVSISRPYLRPIVRGKAKSPVEFGAKLDISVADGYTRLETYSFDAYNEATFLKTVIERYHQRTDKYPERVLADKIYRNRENLRFCKEHGIRLSGPALGRPRKDVEPDKKQDYADICERVEVERRISLAKRKCGLGLLTTRLKETTASAIALSIVVLNLRKIQCAFLARLRFCLFWLADALLKRKLAFVQ